MPPTLVAGAPDALDRRRDGRRRLDEDDPVEIADVDPEFQGAGGDDGLELPVLSAAAPRPGGSPGRAIRGGNRRALPARPSLIRRVTFSAVRRLLAKSRVERWVLDDFSEGFGEDRPPGGVHEMLPGIRGKADLDLVALFVRDWMMATSRFS